MQGLVTCISHAFEDDLLQLLEAQARSQWTESSSIHYWVSDSLQIVLLIVQLVLWSIEVLLYSRSFRHNRDSTCGPDGRYMLRMLAEPSLADHDILDMRTVAD